MKYVFELDFRGSVHFGDDEAGYGIEDVQVFAHADTIFSGLINSLASIQHEFKSRLWLNDFLSPQKNDGQMNVPFKVSSFGFVDCRGMKTYYLPKPHYIPEGLIEEDEKIRYGKEFKRHRFISLDTFRKWQQGEQLDIGQILNTEKNDFWTVDSRIQHLTDSITHATQIYRTGIVFYSEDVKPFFMLDLDEEEFTVTEFLKVMNVLKKNGLGGRRSPGCGLFDFSDTDWFCVDEVESFDQRSSVEDPEKPARRAFQEVFNHRSNSSYVFSTFYPENIQDVKALAYDLVLRKGWIFSTSSFKSLKRKTCYMFSEGSVFRSEIRGKIVDVTPSEFNDHRIYRYGIPFTIPFCEVSS